MILHLVNKSPFNDHCLGDCLNAIADCDALLLLEDGVYGALTSFNDKEKMQTIANAGNLYALEADVNSRGLSSLISSLNVINDKEFVQLTVQYPLSQSWF
ncbi:MAG: sulfurtransferase complex subunit TusB [Cellvibrionaceae bacterium]